MPLISNSRSVMEGRPSLLAFVETLAATGFALWLAWAATFDRSSVICRCASAIPSPTDET
jgi:hypothetical protein